MRDRQPLLGWSFTAYVRTNDPHIATQWALVTMPTPIIGIR
ncbi:MAG: hypothetical protein Kow0056_10640 [Coriobacteriia bacterium]